MNVHNYNTITISLSDHEAWILSQILGEVKEFHKEETKNPFALFAVDLHKQINSKIVNKI